MVVKGSLWVSVLYFVFGAYLINIGLDFIKLPGFIVGIESWIILIAGLFLILGGINSFRLRRRYV